MIDEWWFSSAAFSLQTSLNAEEGLYWYHLMRAVRQPKSARSWLTSSFFYAWIVISIVSTTLQCSIGWIHRGKLNMDRQMATVMAVDGIIEFAWVSYWSFDTAVLFLNGHHRVLCAASVVIWKFPAFLDNVVGSSHQNIWQGIWSKCRKLQVPDQKSDLDFTFIMVNYFPPCFDICSLHSRGQQGPDFLPIFIFVMHDGSRYWRVDWEAVDCEHSVSRIVSTFNCLWKLIGTMLFYSLASGEQMFKVAFSLPVGAYLI